MTKSNQGADSIGVHPSAVGLSQYALPWQGGEVVLSHSVPAFPPVETAPTIRVKLTEYHRRPAGRGEDVLLLLLGDAGDVRVLKVMCTSLFTHSRKGPALEFHYQLFLPLLFSLKSLLCVSLFLLLALLGE